MEIVDRDMSQLREELVESISQSEHAMIGMLAKLEIRFDKLELQVAKKMAAENRVVVANSESLAQKGGDQGK